MSTTEQEGGGTLTMLPGGEESSIGDPSPESLSVEAELLAQLKCPECAAEGIEREFKSKGALGKHRSDKHGIAGVRNRGTAVKRVAKIKVQPEGFPAQKFLNLMFPSGIPSDLGVISEINDWATHSETLWNISRKYRK